jgi:predicted phosphodiesterase
MKRFDNFLNMVEKENGRLLILGDLLDWWQTNFGASIVAYLPLLDRLNELEAKWIAGNHDNALVPLIGTPYMPNHPMFARYSKPFEETIGGRRFAFLHGHETDPFCHSLNPDTGEITAIISGMVEDHHKSPFRKGHAIEDLVVGHMETALTIYRHLMGQPGRQEEMIAGVENYRKNLKCDAVLYGHTHAPGNIGDYHFNTGSWARTTDTFVRIDDNGSAQVLEWMGECARPYNKTLG